MGRNRSSTSSQLERATYASITQGALVLWCAKTHGNLGAGYQQGRRILQTGGLRGSMHVRHLSKTLTVILKCTLPFCSPQVFGHQSNLINPSQSLSTVKFSSTWFVSEQKLPKQTLFWLERIPCRLFTGIRIVCNFQLRKKQRDAYSRRSHRSMWVRVDICITLKNSMVIPNLFQ